MKNTVVISLVVLAVIAGLVYKSMYKAPAEKMEATSESTNTDSAIKGDQETVATDTGAMMKAKEIVVVGNKFKFEPSTITVKKGETVKITLKNTDASDEFEIVHDFVIDDLEVQSDEIGEGESTTFEFVADQAGTFEYYCSIGEHRQNGMFGSLVVEE